MHQTKYLFLLPTGGKQNGKISNKVWIANPRNDFEVIEGPPLKEARYFMSSGVYQDYSGVTKIIVAGGLNSLRKDIITVEILNPSISNKWEYGKPWTS